MNLPENLQDGEIVDVLIKGARVRRGPANTLVAVSEWAEPARHVTRVVTLHPDQQQLEVTRRAAAEWPPRHNDIWADGHNGRWFGRLVDSNEAVDEPYVELVPSCTSMKVPNYASDNDLLDRYGPFTLVYRDTQEDGR